MDKLPSNPKENAKFNLFSDESFKGDCRFQDKYNDILGYV